MAQPNEITESYNLAEIWNPQTPRDRTSRELNRMYRLSPDMDPGFFQKFSNAFVGETVTGELIRAATAPNFADTGYEITEEDIMKYAGDLDRGMVNRVIKDSRSFSEFLYETDELRMTNKRRAELFSGGGWGMAEGLGLMILAAGGEAVLLTGLAMALTGGTGGPAMAAGSAITKAHRIKGVFRALSLAAGVDVPLEIARYNLDNTLRPRDAIIAMGAAISIGGTLGALKPSFFLPELRGMSKTATSKEAADAARAAGKSGVADALEPPQQTLRVVPYDEQMAYVDGLSIKELFAQARAAGLETTQAIVGTGRKNKAGMVQVKRKVPKSAKQVRNDLFNHLQETQPSVRHAQVQVAKEWAALKNAAARAEYARKLGVSERAIKRGGKHLTAAVHKKVAKTVRTGSISRGDIPDLPKGFRIVSSLTIKGVKIKFKSRTESVLWVIAKTRDAEKKKALIAWFNKGSRMTIEGRVERLAKQFVKDVEEKALSAKKGGNIDIDIRNMDIRAGQKGLKTRIVGGKEVELEPGQGLFEYRTPHRFKIDDEGGEFPRTIDDPRPHPMEGPEVTVHANGKPVAEGPADMIRIDESALEGNSLFYGLTNHTLGFRETLARFLDIFPGDVPGLRGLYKFFTPVTYRLLRHKSELTRRFADIMLETSRGGGQNISTAVKTNVDRVLSRLNIEMKKAIELARQQGIKLSNKDIVRAVRSGAEIPPRVAGGLNPLNIAVSGIRKFNSELLKYGKEGGVFMEAIPESSSYFHRAYNTRMFTKLVEELGEEQVVDFFAKAIRSHKASIASKLSEKNAKSIAKRIVEYGTNPSGARDWRGTQFMLNKLKPKLIKDGIPEDQVDEFMHILIPHLDNQPHISYGRRRIDLDETFTGRIGGRDVHIDEFFDNNILSNTTRYAQRVIGGVETKKGFKALFGKKGETMTISDVVEEVEKQSIKAGDDSQFAVEVVSHVYNTLVGLPIYANPRLMKWIMGANSFGQATIGMTLGFAQIPEIASIMMRSGFKASLQQFPGIKEVGHIFTLGIRDLVKGRKGLGLQGLSKDDLSATLETFTGIAGDYRRGDHFMRRLDELGFDDDIAKQGFNRWLDYGRQTAMLNPLGIMPMDTFLRRWAVRSSFQHFVNQAYSVKGGKPVLNRGFWNNSRVRFKEIGMDEEMLERLNKTLSDPSIVTLESGMFGRYTVKNVDLEKVTDKFAFDQFALALRRHTDSMVQRQSYGETPAWMNTQVGKLLGQYRVFMMASKSKQLASGIARGDAKEVVNMVGSAGLGLLAYQIQSHYRALGMSDKERKKYLRERFKDNKLIKAGIMKGSYSSIFPMIIDSGSFLLGGEPVFDPSMRTTGLGIDPLRGSVPYSILYGRAWPTLREGTGALFRGDKLSQSDLRNAASLLWMTKIPGMDTATNQIISNLNIQKKDN